MLRSIRVARPVKQGKRLSALFEHRQDHAGRSVGEIGLLYGICMQSSRNRVVPGGLIADGSGRMKPCADEGCRALRTQRNSVRRACLVVDDHRLRYCKSAVDRIELGYILDCCGARFSHKGSVVSVHARGTEQSFLIQIVSAELAIQIAEHWIVLEVRRIRSRCTSEVAAEKYWVPNVDRVAVVARIP